MHVLLECRNKGAILNIEFVKQKNRYFGEKRGRDYNLSTLFYRLTAIDRFSETACIKYTSS